MKGSIMKKEIVCRQCGNKYSYEEEKIIFRDKDEKLCECGNILISWNGSRIPCNFKKIITDKK